MLLQEKISHHTVIEVHKPGKRDNKSRKADNRIREISQLNQYNKQ